MFYLAVLLIYAGAAALADVLTHPGPNRMMALAIRAAAGHLDAPSLAGTVDSVTVGGHTYLAEGLLQLLPYLPFAALPALQGVAGYLASLAFGVPAAWLALPLARRYGAPGSRAYWVAGLAAFGTLLFFVSVLGSLYYLAHAEAFLFLELALFDWAGARRPAVQGICYGLAFLARPTTLLALVPFGLALLWVRHDRMRAATRLAVPVVAALAIFAAYNELRFGSPLQTGYGISLLTDPALEARRALGLFSIAQVPENLRLALLQGFGFSARFPYLVVDPSGLSMLLVSPGLLTALWAGWHKPVARLLWLAAVLVAVPVFLYYGGGYAQYGFRYSLDFTPFLVALVALGARRWIGTPERLLITISGASVGYGVLWAAHAFR